MSKSKKMVSVLLILYAILSGFEEVGDVLECRIENLHYDILFLWDSCRFLYFIYLCKVLNKNYDT